MMAFLLGALVYTFLASHVICWPFVEHFGCALKTRWITLGLLGVTLWIAFAGSQLRSGSEAVRRQERAVLWALLGVCAAYFADGIWWSIAGMIQIGGFYVAFP